MHTHRSPKPAFPASWRVDPERLEETLNHLFVTYTPLPIITFLPVSRWSISTLRLQITKTEKRGTGQSPCFSWVIYLFMEALYSHFKRAGIITEAQWVTPVSLQTQDFPCSVATEKQTSRTTKQVSWGLADRKARRTVLSRASACQYVDLIPKAVNFLRLCSRSRT